MERKEFLKMSLGLLGITAIPAAMVVSCSKQKFADTNVNFTLDLTAPANASLNTANGYIVNGNVIVIRTGASSYVALSTICTHQGCNVSYVPSYSELVCPCHGGAYSLSGAVISGPPPAPLTQYKTTLSGHMLTVTS